MSDLIHLIPAESFASALPDVEIFDPPMCCSTGLCGPAPDQTLLDVSETLLSLQLKGLHVKRYQMSTSPQAFLGHAEVLRLVREQQVEALPITVVRGHVIKFGSYASTAEIEAALGGSEA